MVSYIPVDPFHTLNFCEHNNTTHGLLRSTFSDILDKTCTFSHVTAGVCQLRLSVIIHFINHSGFKESILVSLWRQLTIAKKLASQLQYFFQQRE